MLYLQGPCQDETLMGGVLLILDWQPRQGSGQGRGSGQLVLSLL